jgi:hypothetical protein
MSLFPLFLSMATLREVMAVHVKPGLEGFL